VASSAHLGWLADGEHVVAAMLPGGVAPERAVCRKAGH
jgi:hypothetical protein